jgi:hypothetical protein
MFLRIHQNKGKIVAACDEDLIGKVLEGEGACLDLVRYKPFYVGEKADEADLEAALARFESANLVGKKAVGVAIKMGLITEKDVMYIKKTPYIQIYRL